MHDDPLERRLGVALKREADGLAFTITAAELERRLSLRGGGMAGRRRALLLAAAVGIGLVGVGGVIGSVVDDPTRTPSPTTVAKATGPTPASTDPTRLPTLDEFIANALGNEVAIAQAHEFIDTGGTAAPGMLPNRVSVSLGMIEGSAEYQLTFMCLGGGVASVEVRSPDSLEPDTNPSVECNGVRYEQPIYADGPRTVRLTAPREVDWRIVIRRLAGAGPTPGADLELLGSQPDEEELVRADLRSIDAGAPPAPEAPALTQQEIGTLPGRRWYRVRASCIGGSAIRHVVGHEIEGVFQARISTAVPCDGLVHEALLEVPQPDGADLHVAAEPEARWSVVVSGEVPPVEVVRDLDGWRLSSGYGPELAFDTHGVGISDVGVEGGGPLLVVLECAGERAAIEVGVDLTAPLGEAQETFSAACTPAGSRTSQTFMTGAGGFHVEFVAPAGSWTSLTILIPEASPQP